MGVLCEDDDKSRSIVTDEYHRQLLTVFFDWNYMIQKSKAKLEVILCVIGLKVTTGHNKKNSV